MKNENLPQVGRDVIFETTTADVFAGVFNGSEYVVALSSGKTIAFEGREVVAWIYAKDAFAAWKLEQVRRVKIPPVNHVNTAILREEVLRKIQHEYVLADVETALDKYVDAVVKNYEQPPSEDCIGITGYESKADRLSKLRDTVLYSFEVPTIEKALNEYIDLILTANRLPENCISTADLREQRRYEIASKILTAKCTYDGGYSFGGIDSVTKQAKEAIMYADALLAELEKPEQK